MFATNYHLQRKKRMNTRTQGEPATKTTDNRLAVAAINRRMAYLLIGLCGVSLMLGAHTIAWADLSIGSGEAWLMLTASRLPRLVAILLTGIGLAVSGVILQQMVQNRFVEPGTSGGLDAAKLGILIALTQIPTAGKIGQMLLALAFCLATSLVYIAIIRRIQFKNTTLVPVIGLMYGGLLSACAEFYAYQYNIMQSMQGWLLGDFSKVVQGQYEVIYLILPIVAVTYLYAHRFTVMGMGEETAKSLGLGYTTTAAMGLMLVAITVSVTVISVGAIYFVGLVIPNLVALHYGDNLRHTLPTVALGGALLLLACDIVGRLLVYPFEVPIGLTAGAIGGAIFLALILRGDQR
ncbi:ABC transporter permease [Terasakiispira papahanaumokuakeensis]|nr:iron chelate uptake ABC transporter family permease subunit [Terasakiispira papahanaumokuakeensis]